MLASVFLQLIYLPQCICPKNLSSLLECYFCNLRAWFGFLVSFVSAFAEFNAGYNFTRPCI